MDDDRRLERLGEVEDGGNTDDLAVSALILSHTEIACRMAKKLLREWRYRMDRDEIEGHAYVALCEAARRFDPNRGCQFTTFFHHHLRGHLLQAIEASASNSRVKLAVLTASGSKLKTLRDYEDQPLSGEPINPDFEQSTEVISPEEMLLGEEASSLVLLECGKLTEEEQEVIRRMFLCNESPAVVAKALSRTRREILQIRERAIVQLRKVL